LFLTKDDCLSVPQVVCQILKYVNAGEVYVGNETGFVFAEVNSDRITWIVQQEETGDYTISG